jgi:hypothetical protein
MSFRLLVRLRVRTILRQEVKIVAIMLEKMARKSLPRPNEALSLDRRGIELVKVGENDLWADDFAARLEIVQVCETDRPYGELPSLAFDLPRFGQLQVMMENVTKEEFGPGHVSLVPPGHDAWKRERPIV